MHQQLNVRGSRTLLSAAGNQTVPGGLLALQSNTGQSNRHTFALVPEAQVNLGVQVTEHLFAYLGYNFLYWNKVGQPGESIDRTVNPGLVPTSATFGTPGGPARPGRVFAETDFWAHGLNAGLAIEF